MWQSSFLSIDHFTGSDCPVFRARCDESRESSLASQFRRFDCRFLSSMEIVDEHGQELRSISDVFCHIWSSECATVTDVIAVSLQLWKAKRNVCDADACFFVWGAKRRKLISRYMVSWLLVFSLIRMNPLDKDFICCSLWPVLTPQWIDLDHCRRCSVAILLLPDRKP